VAQSLQAAFDGLEISELREGEDNIPIVLRLEQERRRDIEQSRTVNIFSENGAGAVPLTQVSYFDVEYEYATIRRRDLERTVTVSGRHPGLAASELAARLQPGLDALELPPGYRIEHGGELEAAAEANAALFAAVPACFAAMCLLLVWQFNSVRRALLIVLTIPLSLTGAVAGLLLTGAPLGFTAILGLISLAGMIVFNAIVLIERVESGVAEGEPPRTALLAACVERLRPIVITNLTTIVGLIPLMLFGGELWFAMSVVIAGGLLVGTVLTLGVIPALYSLMLGVRVGR
jgi:multidrug efflux pump subunit AcrB